MILRLVATLCVLYYSSSTANGNSTKNVDKTEAYDMLTKFGYVDPGRSGNGDFRTALERYQRFFHLKVTGVLDDATKKEMEKPRCGNADEADDTGRSAQAFKTGPKWRKTRLTYRFLRASRDVSYSVMRSTFQKAFRYWSNVTPLTFTEVSSGRSDFTIMFASRSHGDGSPFDGPGRVLAHAYFPSNGRVHFDEDERYTVNGARGIDLLAVAVHEIGHAIGLHHSNVRGSIMWPSYTGYNRNLRLHNDDIRGVQSLYGRKTGGGGGTGGSCSDKNTKCGGWRRYCNDSRYKGYMSRNCAKTCGHCRGGSCADKNQYCGTYKRQGYCVRKYVVWMRRNCAKSCGRC